jgi:hypothetical protein
MQAYAETTSLRVCMPTHHDMITHQRVYTHAYSPWHDHTPTSICLHMPTSLSIPAESLRIV